MAVCDEAANESASARAGGKPFIILGFAQPSVSDIVFVEGLTGHPRTYVAVDATKRGPVPRACAKVADH
jgi:hypothetical protein